MKKETKKLTVEIPIESFNKMHDYCIRYPSLNKKCIFYRRFIICAIDFYIDNHT